MCGCDFNNPSGVEKYDTSKVQEYIILGTLLLVNRVWIYLWFRSVCFISVCNAKLSCQFNNCPIRPLGSVFSRYSAPSIGAFGENSPQGSGKDAARFRRGRKPLPKTLGKSEKRRIKAECRVAFSLNTFFWPRKRKYFGCRSENRH